MERRMRTVRHVADVPMVRHAVGFPLVVARIVRHLGVTGVVVPRDNGAVTAALAAALLDGTGIAATVLATKCCARIAVTAPQVLANAPLLKHS